MVELSSNLPCLEPSYLLRYFLGSVHTIEPSFNPSDAPSTVSSLKPNPCQSTVLSINNEKQHLQCWIKVYLYHTSNIKFMF